MDRFRRSGVIVVAEYVIVFVLGVLWDAPWTVQKSLLYVVVPLAIGTRIWRERARQSLFAPSKVGSIKSPRS
jgi:hypothetical protein